MRIAYCSNAREDLFLEIFGVVVKTVHEGLECYGLAALLADILKSQCQLLHLQQGCI